MNDTNPARRASRLRAGGLRSAVTLMELLVVLTIITILVAILMPAINAARERSREAGCASNLRQIGVGLQAHASRNGAFCTGAFDWFRDGSVVDRGWVADLVNQEIPVGEMLCPSNTAKLSETFHDLLAGDWAAQAADACNGITLEDLAGRPDSLLPDGSTDRNPCRAIVEGTAGGGALSAEDRVALVAAQIHGKSYNTNYTASWLLVRGGPLIAPSTGKLQAPSGCAGDLESRASTRGPLAQAQVDGGDSPSSFIPLLGDGAPGAPLTQALGDLPAGTFTVKSITAGPVLTTTLVAPDPNTAREGTNGWWKIWTKDTLQDYRRFAPLHGGNCNVLFADGSVRALKDENGDGMLNNGFPAGSGGFTDVSIELPAEGVVSGPAIKSL